MAPSKLLKPQALKDGDRLAIIPLASTIQKNVLDSGLQFIKQLDFKAELIFDPVFRNYKSMFSAVSAKKRAEGLLGAFKNKNIDAVLSVRGGYGSAEMLPLIDFKAVARSAKIFCGFSDITALLVNLYQKSGLVCVHAPSLLTYGDKALKGSQDALKSLAVLNWFLRGEIKNPFEKTNLKIIKKGASSVKGRLTGGNLCILASLLGTEWEANFDKHIVFLEETGEAPYRVHRMLTQMRLAGKFDKVQALLLGDFIDTRKSVDKKEPTYEEVILDVFKDKKFPILKGLPVGHGDLNYPMPIGLNAELKQNRLEFREQAVIL